MKRMGITTLTLPFLFLKLLHLPSVERARPHDDRLKTYDHVRKLENERLSFSLSSFTRIQREDFQSFSSFLFFLYIYIDFFFLLARINRDSQLARDVPESGTRSGFLLFCGRSSRSWISSSTSVQLFCALLSPRLPSSSLSSPPLLRPRRGKGSLYHWRDACTPCRRWLWTHP